MKKVLLMLVVILTNIYTINAQQITCDYDKVFILYGGGYDSNYNGKLDEEDFMGNYKDKIQGMLTLKYKDFESIGNILYLTYSTGNNANKSRWENVKIIKRGKTFFITDCTGDDLAALVYDYEKKSYFLFCFNVQVMIGNK